MNIPITQVGMKRYSFIKTVSVEKIAEKDNDDWQFLQESLQPCLSALRSTLDKDAYQMCLEQYEDLLEDSVVARTQTISSVVQDFFQLSLAQ